MKTNLDQNAVARTVTKSEASSGQSRQPTHRVWLIAILLFLSCVPGFAQTPPVPPNQFFPFETNFVTASENVPLSYSTNLISTPVTGNLYYSSLVILDTTNLSSASLCYNVRDTNPYPVVNINYSQGTLLFYYVPNWASVSQGGTGPGSAASYLIAGGDWSAGCSNGLFQFYVDAPGSNLVFATVKAGTTNIFASAPISWPSNTFHQIGLEWESGSDCEIYLDGTLAVYGGSPASLPNRSTWTNGFLVMSDNTGYEQGRGGMFALMTWSQEYGGGYTNGWLYESNQLATWQASLGGGFGGMMAMGGGLGGLIPTNCGCGCVTNTSAQIVNITLTTNRLLTFTIESGQLGYSYDIFAATNIVGNYMTNAAYAWLGRGTNCGTYSITPPTNTTFFILGGPQLGTNGVTAAIETLIPNWNWADPNNSGTGPLTLTIVSPAQGAIIQ